MRTLSLLFVLACLVILPVATAVAQEPPPPAPPTGPAPGPAPGPSPTPNIPGPGREPTSPGRQQGPFDPTSQRQQQPFEDRRPIFLSGKVTLDDGTPPPEPVVIETNCNGQIQPQAYSDSKGRFSFQLGQRNAVMIDASTSSSAGGLGGRGDPMGNIGLPAGASSMGGGGAMGAMNLMGCELRASLPGYRSEAVMLGRRSIFDNPEVGTIVLRRLGNVEGAAISFTTLAAPKDAKKSFEKAQNLVRSKPPKHSEAAKELEKAVQLYPQFAAAWNMLGESRLALKDEEGARKAFEQSISADPKYLNPLLRLSVLEMRASKWTDAASLTSRLVQLNPQMGQAHLFNAIANYNLGRMELAEKSVRSALKAEEAGRLPQAHNLLGVILARKMDYPAAAEEMRTFLRLAPAASGTDQVRKQLSDWEALGVIPKEPAPAAPAAPPTLKEKK